MKDRTMNALETAWNALVTYAAVGFALFLAHSSTITAVGGVILLLARLTHELPRAWKALRNINTKE